MSVKLLIFDMDGLMFDSERISKQCWMAVGKEYGITLDDGFFDGIFGMTIQNIKKTFLARYGEDFPFDAFYEKKKAMHLAIYREKGAPVKPGLRELLAYAKKNHILCAVASSSALSVVNMLLRMAGIAQYFAFVQSGQQIKRSKPAPDIFLAVCDRLHMAPREALVLEDSSNGLKAAANAGIRSIWVPDIARVDRETAATAWHTCQTLGDVPELLDKQ